MKISSVVSFAAIIVATGLSSSAVEAALRGNNNRQLSSCSWYDATCGHGLLTKHNAFSNAVVALGDCGINFESCLEDCATESSEKTTLQNAKSQANSIDTELKLMRTTRMPEAQQRLDNATLAQDAYESQAGGVNTNCSWDGGSYNTTCRMPEVRAIIDEMNRHGSNFPHTHHPTNHRIISKLDCSELYYRVGGEGTPRLYSGEVQRQQMHHLSYEHTDNWDGCFAGCEGNPVCAYATHDVTGNCNHYAQALQCTPSMPRTDTGPYGTTFQLYVKDHREMAARLDRDVKESANAFNGYVQQLNSLKPRAQAAHQAVVDAKSLLSHNKCNTLITRFEDLEKSMEDVVDVIEKWAAAHVCQLEDVGFKVLKMGAQAFVEAMFSEVLVPLQESPMCEELIEEEAENEGKIVEQPKYEKEIKICAVVFGALDALNGKVPSSIKSINDCAGKFIDFINDDILQKLGKGSSKLKKAANLFAYFTEKTANMMCGQIGTELIGMLEDIIMCNNNAGPNGESCGKVLGTADAVCHLYQGIF